MIRRLRPGSFRKKSLSLEDLALEDLSLSLLYSWNLSGRHRKTNFAPLSPGNFR